MSREGGHLMRILGALVCMLGLGIPSVPAQDFWAHWGDGKAELNGYRLTQPRYGKPRAGQAVLIFVTENMSDTLRVKADPGRHPDTDVYPVMKLNHAREFRTGIYPYHVLTSVFARVKKGWPLAKVSFSSQEWCGHVYHQILPRAGALEGVFHSYFDGEADGRETLALPPDGVYEDTLPILLRGWLGDYLRPGEGRTVPFLPSLLTARLQHKPLAWGRATIARSADTISVKTPAGVVRAWRWTVAVTDGPTLTFDIEDGVPHRVVRWATSDGEEALLTGTARLAYWELNQPGGESHLKDLGF